MVKRIAACVCAFFMCISACIGASSPQPVISAASWVLYDPWLDTVVLEKDAHIRRGMASTTKIMTGALALELYSADQAVAIRPEWTGIEGSSMYLEAGERLWVSDLVYGLMLMSGNDAATALAGLYSGREADFVALMNDRAQALGLSDTHFDNPSGLDGETHYSTAYDMARLAAWAMENPDFCQIVGTQSVERAGRYMKNHNKLLRTLEGATGIKTGFTKASGRCLVSSCTRNGRTLIAVTLDAPNDWRDHTALYDWAFSGMAHLELCQPGPLLAKVYLANGTEKQCGLYVDERFEAYLSPDEQESVSLVLSGPRIWYGDAVQGEQWGRLSVMVGDRSVFEAPAYFSQSVPAEPVKPGLLGRLTQWLVDIFNIS